VAELHREFVHASVDFIIAETFSRRTSSDRVGSAYL